MHEPPVTGSSPPDKAALLSGWLQEQETLSQICLQWFWFWLHPHPGQALEIWAESPLTLPGPPTVAHMGPASGFAAGRRLGSLIWAPHGTGLREVLHTLTWFRLFPWARARGKLNGLSGHWTWQSCANGPSLTAPLGEVSLREGVCCPKSKPQLSLSGTLPLRLCSGDFTCGCRPGLGRADEAQLCPFAPLPRGWS